MAVFITLLHFTICLEGSFKEAFVALDRSAEFFYNADNLMRAAEYGVWKGFYFNDCFADVKHTEF